MAANLITRAEYKANAGINSINQDAEIDSLIPKISQLIKTYCRRSFVDYYDEPKTENFNGGFNRFLLKESPLVSVASVETSADFGKTYTPLTEYEDYVVEEETDSVVAIGTEGFPKLLKGYKVTYFAGFEKVPEDLKLAALDMVSYYMKNDSSVHTHKNANPNTMQVEYISNTQFPAHIRRVLDHYAADYT